MDEIKVSVEKLQTEIAELLKLHNEITTSNKAVAPSVEGGGLAIGKIEELKTEFINLENNIAELVYETSIFMKKILDTYVETDKEISSSISLSANGGGSLLNNRVSMID